MNLFNCSGFKWLGIVLLVALMMPAAAKAQDLKRAQQILNDYSHENAVCSAYYLFVMKCLKNKNPNISLVGAYERASREFLHRSLVAGKASGVSDAAMEGRISLEIDAQRTATENNCSNIAVLNLKQVETCKALYNHGPDKLEADMNGAGLKQ